MLRIIEEPKEENPRIIEMKDMKPLQVGRIVDERVMPDNGLGIVRRTSSKNRLEVENLTNPGADNCWCDDDCDLKVELLSPGESITIELFNEE